MPQDPEWFVQIRDKIGSPDLKEVFVFRRGTHAGMTEIYRGDVVEIVSPGGEAKPSFLMSTSMLQSLCAAIRSIGIHDPDRGEIAGKLEAQSAHLEDLRTLLKLNKIINVHAKTS